MNWEYTIRIDGVSREQLAAFHAAFEDVSWVDPREVLARTDGADRRARVMSRHPDLDVIRVLIPITPALRRDALNEMLSGASVGALSTDVVFGCRLRSKRECVEIPDYVLDVVRATSSEILLNITDFADGRKQ